MTDNDLADEPNPRAQIGGNQPRDFDLLKERVEDLAKTANQWCATVPEITTEEIAARADDYLNQLTAAAKNAEKAKAAEKRPHIDAGKEIERRYAEIAFTIEAIKATIGPKVTRWLRKKDAAAEEAKRLQREHAELLRKAAEIAAAKASAGQGDVIGNQVRAAELASAAAEAQKAAARPVERAQVRGTYSTRARSLVSVRKAEVIDVLLAFCHYQCHSDIKEVLTKLASADARAGKEDIPGCRIYREETAR